MSQTINYLIKTETEQRKENEGGLKDERGMRETAIAGHRNRVRNGRWERKEERKRNLPKARIDAKK